MTDRFERIEVAAEMIRSKAAAPRVGVILGSGLSGFGDRLEGATRIPYAEIPGFPVAAVPGHPGRLVVGRIGGAEVVALQGRVHGYEGYAPWEVAFPAQVLCRLGIRALVTTNAAGGIRADLLQGDLMRISDHIDLSGMNPLVGPNDERLGPRFPDLSKAYDLELTTHLYEASRQVNVTLKTGVYACMRGPSYETPAEIRMLRTLGADAVGMSTIPEVIAAVHMGVPVVGISCITNAAAAVGGEPLSHTDVAAVAARAGDRFAALLSAFLPKVADAHP